MAKANEESKLQCSCVKWFRLQYPQHIIFAIPNGGRRSKVEAAIMNGEGVLSGVPDLQILMPDGYSFFIEMKFGKNTLTENQKKIQKKISDLYFSVYTCYTFDEFVKAVNWEIKK